MSSLPAVSILPIWGGLHVAALWYRISGKPRNALRTAGFVPFVVLIAVFVTFTPLSYAFAGGLLFFLLQLVALGLLWWAWLFHPVRGSRSGLSGPQIRFLSSPSSIWRFSSTPSPAWAMAAGKTS